MSTALGQCTTSSPTGSGTDGMTLSVLSDNSLGLVVSEPPGINCFTACTAQFPAGSTVTLTATVLEGTGATFQGWSGACSGSATTCSVQLGSAQAVTASWGRGQPPQPMLPTVTAAAPPTLPSAGGTTITLTGTGFVQGTKVVIDGVEVTEVTVVSPTELSFVAPAKLGSSGPVVVKLTTPAGQTVTRSDLVTRYLSVVSFTRTTDVPVSLASFIRVADVDGDGVLDLLMPGPSAIQIAPGVGDGTFKTLITVPTGNTAFALRDIVVGDLNKDKKPDVVCGNDEGTSVLLGKGNFTFDPGVIYSASAGLTSLALADLDGDQSLDVVTVSRNTIGGNPPGINVLLGMGDGTLKAPVYYAAKQPDAIAIADFNGDKKLDLIAAQERTKDVAYLAGKGDGTFQPGVDILTNQNYPATVFPIDYDKDGKLDFVVANTTGVPTLHLGKGDGTFAAAQSIPVPKAGNFDVWVGDLNKDGIYDIVTKNYQDQMLHVLIGKAGGGFAPELLYTNPMSLYGYGGMAVADLNGDNLPDLVSSNQDDTKAFVLLNTSK